MREEKIKITRVRCITDNVANLTKDKLYVIIRLHDDGEGIIQCEICNNSGKIYWYPISLFEVVRNE